MSKVVVRNQIYDAINGCMYGFNSRVMEVQRDEAIVAAKRRLHKEKHSPKRNRMYRTITKNDTWTTVRYW